MASISQKALSDERVGWSFARLLDWHLTRGTRPTGDPETPGRQWTNKELASRLGNDERTIRNWRGGRNVPPEIVSIERELFGDNPNYAAWRAELRQAHRAARASETAPAVGATKSEPIISLPYPSLGSLFKGRDGFLQDLHTSLSRGSGRTAITGSALYGLGGIGKTRAAVEYAWAHQDDYTALLFVIAETPEALRRNLAALAGPLVLNLAEQHAVEEDVRLKAMLDWLKAHPGWFLILDNLDTPEALEEAEKLLSTLTGGRVLITSRLANFAGHFDPLELDVLNVEDAAAFLLERTDRRRQKTPDDAATARRLANDLGGLALALEQAGAYVAKLGISFSRYRELWQENWDKVAGWSDERITKYPRAVAVTWQTSVNQLTPAGRRLLERLAWFAPEPIANFLLEVPVPDVEGDPEHGPNGLTPPVSSPGSTGRSSNPRPWLLDRPVKPGDDSKAGGALTEHDLADALVNLAEYSLARRNADKQEFSIHRLVQDVTRRGLAEQQRQRSLIEAVAWANVAFVGDPEDVRTWPRLDPLAPHVRVIVEHADGAEIREPTARLMYQLGSLLLSKAQYIEAERLSRRALLIAEASYGPDHPNVATSLDSLAELLQATNRLRDAEPLYRRALAIDEKSYGPDHPDVAIRLNYLAGLLRATNRLGEAEPLVRRALAIEEKSYGPDNPRLARSLNNIASLLRDTNRLSEAEPLFRRALAISEARYGPNHPDVATGLNNLAALLRATNRLNEAEPLYRRALAIDERSYGPAHPQVATGLNNLAALLRATNRLSEAEPLFRRALAINEASYGPDHPNVAAVLNNLAGMMRATNRLNEAEPLYRRALAVNGASYGPDHPDVARSLNNLAGLLEDTNQLSQAEPLYLRALAIDEASYGPDHPNVAIRLNNLASLLRATNRLNEAEPLYRRALEILAPSTWATGYEHPNLEVVRANYVQALGELGRTEAEIDAALESILDDGREPPP